MGVAIVNRTVTLYHVTLDSNWQSIALLGLLTAFSEGRKDAIWLVSESRIRWAIGHISRLRHIEQERMILIKLTVRRSWLTRTSLRGVWVCREDICPRRIIEIRRIMQ